MWEAQTPIFFRKVFDQWQFISTNTTLHKTLLLRRRVRRHSLACVISGETPGSKTPWRFFLRSLYRLFYPFVFRLRIGFPLLCTLRQTIPLGEPVLHTCRERSALKRPSPIQTVRPSEDPSLCKNDQNPRTAPHCFRHFSQIPIDKPPGIG